MTPKFIFFTGGQVGFSKTAGERAEVEQPAHSDDYQGAWSLASQCAGKNLRHLQNGSREPSGLAGQHAGAVAGLDRWDFVSGALPRQLHLARQEGDSVVPLGRWRR